MSLKEKLKEKLKKILPKDWTEERPVRILITGKTGTGKSAVINGIVGNEVTEEGGGLKRCTTEVKPIAVSYNGVKMVIWDTPGLQDTTDTNYIQKMQNEGCGDADLVLYCTRMDETRLREDDKQAIEKLTKGFGKDLWNHTLFVLTFANRVSLPPQMKKKKSEKEHFNYRMDEWKSVLSESLMESGVSKEVAGKICLVPAGHSSEPNLPDRENWLSPLFFACLFKMSTLPQVGLLLANYHRFKPEDQMKKEDSRGPTSGQSIPIPKCFVYGPPVVLAIVGAVICPPVVGIAAVGTVVGGAVGGATGIGLSEKIKSYYAE